MQPNIKSSPRQGPQGAPTLTVNYCPVTVLLPCPQNPRAHSTTQIRQIARSIRAFGFLVPILIDSSNNVIAGHGRLLAAQQLGHQEVPIIRIEHLTPAQLKAFMIADNRLVENSGWDDKLLAATLSDLTAAALDFDIETTGFTLDEIELRIEGADSLNDGTLSPDDNVPTLHDGPPVSVLGDLWALGEHRILHGDATIAGSIGLLMNGKRAAMTFTDPPYGVNYANSPKDKLRGTHRPILNDDLGDEFGAFLSAACRNILTVTDGAVYMCMSSSALHLLQEAFAQAGGHWSTFIIWAKQAFTIGRSDYQRQYEPMLYGWREGATRHWCGARDQGDVWFINRPVRNDLHPTMKPVELVMRALRNSSRRGDLILDPFLGSGSSLIAAERTGRTCYGMDLDAAFVDVAVRRWQSHSGEEAVHVASGRTFKDIATERGANVGGK